MSQVSAPEAASDGLRVDGCFGRPMVRSLEGDHA